MHHAPILVYSLTIFAQALTPYAPAAGREPVSLDAWTPLDRYVAQEDLAYTWRVVDRRSCPHGQELAIELTSQSWRGKGEVDRTLWKHWLLVCIPKEADSKTAMLLISGGRNGGRAPEGCGDLIRRVAASTGSVVAELLMVPNQPLMVNGDGKRRTEDDLLAASWRMYLKTRDPAWIAQLPMAKSAVKAMDALQECLPREAPQLALERFVVAGASKRGWTTWLTAAVDDRVAAIAPIVIDVLNIGESMRHHHAVYGFWSGALRDYEQQGLAEKLSTPACQEILQIVDPYEYRGRFTMPKCLINASGDEFFLPDSSRFYYNELPGEKHLCYVPNAGHSLKGSNAIDTLIAFHYCIVHKVQRPNVQCSLSPRGELKAVCSEPPESATLFTAVNPHARDFRLPVIGKAYAAAPIVATTPVEYAASIESPPAGWAASFAQFEFDVGAPTPFRVTSPVWVTPDTKAAAPNGSGLGL